MLLGLRLNKRATIDLLGSEIDVLVPYSLCVLSPRGMLCFYAWLEYITDLLGEGG